LFYFEIKFVQIGSIKLELFAFQV